MNPYLNQKTEKEAERIVRLPHDTLAQIRSALDAELLEQHVHVAGKDFPIPMPLNPIFLTQAQKQDLIHTARLVHSALRKVAEKWYRSERMREDLAIDPFEERLFLETDRPEGFGIMRFDTFWDGHRFRFLELNTDYPDGIFISYAAKKAYMEILRKYDLLGGEVEPFPNDREEVLHAILAPYRKNGGTKERPTIAIVAPKGRAGDNEYFLMASFLNQKGYDAFHAEPSELDLLSDHSLSYRENRIDIVRRAAEIRYFRDVPGGEMLFDAYRNRSAVFVNSFHDRLLGIKSLFAILHDPKYQSLFSEKERKAINDSIPKTYIVSKKDQNENMREVSEEKERFVLKPSGLSEGEQVYFGRDMKQKEWEMMLKSDASNGYIAQEIVHGYGRPVVDFSDKGPHIVRHYSDLSIHVMIDERDEMKFGNILNRVSPDPIINISRGGGLSPVFTSEDDR